jgi:hypothetical protein
MAKPEQKAGAGKAGKNKKFKKRERKNVPFGIAYVQATFNNTIVTITDPVGNTLSWKSSGSLGFRGSRRVHPSRRSRQPRTPPAWRAITVCARSMCGFPVRVRAASRLSAHWLLPVSRCEPSAT